MLGFRRLKGIRIARWNESRRRSEEVAALLRDVLEGRPVCCRITGTAIDDLDLRSPLLRHAEKAATGEDRPPPLLESMTAIGVRNNEGRPSGRPSRTQWAFA